MLPTFTTGDCTNGACAYAKPSRERFYRFAFVGAFLAYLSNLVFGKNSPRAFRSGRNKATSYGVPDVLAMSSRLKVRWVDTGRIVALVHHFTSIWNLNSKEHEGEPIRRINTAIEPKVAMSGLALTSSPNPARSKLCGADRYWTVLINFLKEPLEGCFLALSFLFHKKQSTHHSRSEVRTDERQRERWVENGVSSVFTATSWPAASMRLAFN